mgnify:CR=1 FL=1
MEKTTHRQYLAWQAWFDLQLNNPDKVDFYLMQIAAEVRRTIVKEPSKVDANAFKINLKTVQKPLQTKGKSPQANPRATQYHTTQHTDLETTDTPMDYSTSPSFSQEKEPVWVSEGLTQEQYEKREKALAQKAYWFGFVGLQKEKDGNSKEGM